MEFEKLKCGLQVSWSPSRCFVSVLLAKWIVNLFCLVRQNDQSMERSQWVVNCCVAGTQQRSQFSDLRQTGKIHTVRQLRQLSPFVGCPNLSIVTYYQLDSSNSMAIQTTLTVFLLDKMITSFSLLQMTKPYESGTCTSFSANPFSKDISPE